MTKFNSKRVERNAKYSFYATYYYKIHQMHDSDIFLLKIGIPDKNDLFATLPGGAGLNIYSCIDLLILQHSNI